MPIYRLSRHIVFPDPREADPDGLLAIGGDLSPQRLLTAYACGIFPWPHGADWPLLWFSPDPRLVLLPEALHVSRSLRKTLHRGLFEVRFDTAFEQVIQACAAQERPGQQGTWITPEMIRAYQVLYNLGFAHSAEAWMDGQLVGGLYGIALGAAFFGESMFTHRSDASKVALVRLVQHLQGWGFHFVDCQIHTPHLSHFGAEPWPRDAFLSALDGALQVPTRQGSWRAAATV